MNVDLLESRIVALERLILGNSFAPPAQKPEQTITQMLSNAQKQMTLAEKRSIIKALMDKTSELHKYMDPHFLDELALSNAAKLKVILSQEAEIVKTAQALEALQSLKGVLNHPAYSDLPNMKAQFARLLQRHSEQESKTNDFVDECNEVLRTYSETTRDLSKMLIAWHKKVNEAK